VAKLAGAPGSKAAGIEMHVRLGAVLEAGEPLCTVCSETTGELQYALDYAREVLAIFEIDRESTP
jgi:thymidine phosphorylase